MQRVERGCLPCTNAIVSVPQDRFIAAEWFGSFYGLHGPGLACVGMDCCGICVSLRSISSRVEQLGVSVETKTRDNVFVNALVAVQFSVSPEGARDAFYKLSDVGAQIDSYVSDVVRSQFPKMTLDEAFEAKDEISALVQQDLAEHMTAYGFQVHKALVTEVAVNPEVMRSMNEINKQKRLRDASVMAAEAEKIRVVKAAEAEADATHLAGLGIARQRGAIVSGLRESIATSGRELTQADVMELMLTTQYFETLRDIGSHKNCKAYFLPDEQTFDSQVRQGMLEGQAALEWMVAVDSGAVGWSPPPRQQSMAQSPPSRRRRGGGGGEVAAPTMDEDYGAGEAAPPQPRRSQQRPSPPPAARPAQPAAHQPVTLQIQVPPGVGPGQVLQCQAPDGRMVQVQVPPGVAPGAVLQVQV